VKLSRRHVLVLLSATFGGALSAYAAPAKIPKIGVLIVAKPDQEPALREFRAALRNLGYFEGQNIFIEVQSAEGKRDRLPELAARLVRDKVDIIAAWMTPAVTAAKDATTEIPIVMLGAGDPVGTGLVASLARPGGNITGIAGVTAELAGKTIELLKEMLPSMRRAAALCNASDPFSQPFLKQIQLAGHTLGIEVAPIMAIKDHDVDSVFAAALEKRVDGVIVQPSLQLKHAAQMALRDHLPAASPSPTFAGLGGLLGYGGLSSEGSSRAALFVDKILKGRSPAELPVERPTRFDLVINLRTAKVLGITVPGSLLARADQVIE
jgi:putative tryptophan/tyrosine transport system substrate-binding protein